MNSLTEGFKETEVGVIPKDWELKPISEVCQIFGRIGFRGYTVDDIVQEGNGAITISPSNIQDNKIEFKKCTYISWFKYEESPEIKIFNGDILLVKTGSTFGKTAIVKGLPTKATINPQLVVLKKIKIDNFFFAYMMGFKIVQNQITTAIVGGAIPTLSQQLVSKFLIPLPPTKAEQAAIATALNDADALITQLEKLIAKKRNIKQGAMQELLIGKKRLPGFNEKWEVKKLGDTAEVVMGQSPVGTSYNPSGIGAPLINGPTEFTEKHPIKIQWTSQPTKFCMKGDVLLCVRGSSTGRINISDDEYCIGRGIAAIRAKSGADTSFITFQVESAVKKILALTTGSTFPNIDGKSIKAIAFPIPPLPEQTAIAQILSDMDAEIEALEKKLEKYKMLKQGMMQNLLTGRVRLI